MLMSNAGSFPVHLADFALENPPSSHSSSLFVLTYDLPTPINNNKSCCFFHLKYDTFPSVSYIFSRPKKLTLKGYKQYWCTFKDITISCYKSKEEAHGTPALQMNLRGADAPTIYIETPK